MVAQRKKSPRAGGRSKPAAGGPQTRPDATALPGDAAAADPPHSADSHPPESLDNSLNNSLDDVLALMAVEVERLQEALQYFRQSQHPDKDAIIRWHVQQIDLRQDRLSELKALILADRDDIEH